MNVYYAIGAGFGHLSRALAFTQKKIKNKPITILYFAPQIEKQTILRLEEIYNIRLISPTIEEFGDKQKLNLWLNRTLELMNISNFYVDSFPFGLKGELNQFFQEMLKQAPYIKVNYIARLLRWDNYLSLVASDMTFNKCYLVEDLENDHLEWLKSQGILIEHLDLSNSTIYTGKPRNQCLVIHSGHIDETEQLILYAQEKLAQQGYQYDIVLCSPKKPNFMSQGIIHLNEYPLNKDIRAYTCVVSAAGFNILREVNGAVRHHWVMPFSRKYDNQYVRAKIYKNKYAY